MIEEQFVLERPMDIVQEEIDTTLQEMHAIQIVLEYYNSIEGLWTTMKT